MIPTCVRCCLTIGLAPLPLAYAPFRGLPSPSGTPAQRRHHDQRRDRLQRRRYTQRPAVAVRIPAARIGARPEVEDPADRRLDREGQPQPGPVSLTRWLAMPNASGKPRMLGVILGFYSGDSLDPIVHAPEAQAQRLQVRWDQQLLKLLKAKRIDGYLIEASIAPRLTQQNAQALQQHQVSEQKPEPMHLMFSHKVPIEIVQRFDAAIAAQAKP